MCFQESLCGCTFLQVPCVTLWLNIFLFCKICVVTFVSLLRATGAEVGIYTHCGCVCFQVNVADMVALVFYFIYNLCGSVCFLLCQVHVTAFVSGPRAAQWPMWSQCSSSWRSLTFSWRKFFTRGRSDLMFTCSFASCTNAHWRYFVFYSRIFSKLYISLYTFVGSPFTVSRVDSLCVFCR